MTAGVRASAPVEGGRGTDRPALPSAGLPDLHTPERLDWLAVIQEEEARRGRWTVPAIIGTVVFWLSLFIWWVA